MSGRDEGCFGVKPVCGATLTFGWYEGCCKGVETVGLEVVAGAVHVPGAGDCTVGAVLAAGCETMGCCIGWGCVVVVAPPQTGRLPADAHWPPNSKTTAIVMKNTDFGRKEFISSLKAHILLSIFPLSTPVLFMGSGP
ncbi:hypothetical protein MUP29_02490 [bacterium]|nr:hypothetical protein [bacterium]